MIVQQIDKDWSQNAEQWLVLDALSKMGALDHQSGPPQFLDLGAYDGLTGSNTRALSDQGWRGVLVEADPRAFVRLVGNHAGNPNMRCVLGAVVGGVGKARVRQFYDAGDQISTAYGEHRLGGLVKGGWWTGVVSPAELVEAFGDRYEFISVDVEGCDLSVVEALGPCLPYTRLVCFEDTVPNTDFDQQYYDKMMGAWAAHGFDQVVGRTVDRGSGRPCNTILARKEWPPGHRWGEAPGSLKALEEHGEPTRRWYYEENLPEPGKEPVPVAQRPERPRKEPPVPVDPVERAAFYKEKMAKARAARKMSLSEAGRKGGYARAVAERQSRAGLRAAQRAAKQQALAQGGGQ